MSKVDASSPSVNSLVRFVRRRVEEPAADMKSGRRAWGKCPTAYWRRTLLNESAADIRSVVHS